MTGRGAAVYRRGERGPMVRWFEISLTLVLTAAAVRHVGAARKPASQPASAAVDVGTLLRHGQIEQALRLVQEAIRSKPSDPVARREFIDLHVALARRYLAVEDFASAEKVARPPVGATPRLPATVVSVPMDFAPLPEKTKLL